MVIILPLRRGCFHLGNTRIPTMDLKKLFTEERAVSPVIGVILMVAITVILAAVIGAFVLGLGGETQETPQASLSFELNETDDLAVEHRGGDTLDAGELRVTIDGDDQGDEPLGTDEFRSGEVRSVDDTSADVGDGNSVRVIHDPTGGVIGSGTV